MARRLTVPAPLEDGSADLAALALALGKRPDVLEGWAAQLAKEDAQTVEGVMANAYSVGWRSEPCTLANHLTRGEYRMWPYVRLLSSKLKAMVDGTGSRRLIVNMPSRLGKSLAVCWFCVWLYDRRPEAEVIYSTYGDDLANEHATFIRDTMREHSGELRTQLRVDRQRMDRFVTAQGGGLVAAGIDSALIGFGAGNGGGVVLDDPFKNWQDAHSPSKRDHVWNQTRAVLRTRLNDDDAWFCVIHHRMHEDDVTGRLRRAMEDESGEAWEVVSLAAIAEVGRPDPLGRAPGEVIEPERFSLAAVQEKHRGMGTYLVSAMEQQEPAPEEGGELKRAWWRLDDAVPEKYDDMLTSWDMKLKDKESGDYVVGQVWGRVGSHYYLLDQQRGQWSQAITRVAMCLVQVRWPTVHKHVYENAGYGPEVAAELRRSHPTWTCDDEVAGLLGITDEERPLVEELMRRGLNGLLPETPKGSKTIRIRAYSGVIQAGDVHLDARRAWVGMFLDETAAFPNGAHDDMVDACSQALKRLSTSAATVAAPRSQMPRSATSTAKARVLTSRRSLSPAARRPGSQGLPPRPR